jgi:hypothetical protein
VLNPPDLLLDDPLDLTSGKWIYHIKYNPDGTLSRYKARWVVRGCSEQPGVDYGETFSPVIKPATIHEEFRSSLNILPRPGSGPLECVMSCALLHQRFINRLHNGLYLLEIRSSTVCLSPP